MNIKCKKICGKLNALWIYWDYIWEENVSIQGGDLLITRTVRWILFVYVFSLVEISFTRSLKFRNVVEHFKSSFLGYLVWTLALRATFFVMTGTLIEDLYNSCKPFSFVKARLYLCWVYELPFGCLSFDLSVILRGKICNSQYYK